MGAAASPLAAGRWAALAAFIGTLSPLQTSINGILACDVEGGARASSLAMLAAALLLAWPSSRRQPGAPRAPLRMPADVWALAGGPLGATYLVAAVSLEPILGMGTLFVGLSAGQLLGSLALDHARAVAPVTRARLAGLALALASCVAAAAAPASSAVLGPVAEPPPFAALAPGYALPSSRDAVRAAGAAARLVAALGVATLAGAASPAQAAANQRLARALGGAERAGCASAACGALCLSLLLASVSVGGDGGSAVPVAGALGGACAELPPARGWRVPWAALASGAISAASVVVPVPACAAVGAAVYYVCVLLGQLGAALAWQLSAERGGGGISARRAAVCVLLTALGGALIALSPRGGGATAGGAAGGGLGADARAPRHPPGDAAERAGGRRELELVSVRWSDAAAGGGAAAAASAVLLLADGPATRQELATPLLRGAR